MELNLPNPARNTSCAQTFALRNGEIRVVNETAEVRDMEGRLVFRHDGSDAELLVAGNLRIRAGGDLNLDAAGDLNLHAAHIKLVTRRIDTLAQHVVQRVERIETHATQIVERSRDAYRETRDLWQHHAGRMRTLVSRSCDLITQRTALVSREETTIDGKKILLG